MDRSNENDADKVLDLIRSQHTFPTLFTFKFIGPAGGDFVERLVERVKVVLNLDMPPRFRSKLSASGKHVSVTIQPRVFSEYEVVKVYEEIAKIPDVLYSL